MEFLLFTAGRFPSFLWRGAGAYADLSNPLRQWLALLPRLQPVLRFLFQNVLTAFLSIVNGYVDSSSDVIRVCSDTGGEKKHSSFSLSKSV